MDVLLELSDELIPQNLNVCPSEFEQNSFFGSSSWTVLTGLSQPFCIVRCHVGPALLLLA